MTKFELINHLKPYPEGTIIEVFGSGAITSVEPDGNNIRLIAQSKALDAMESIQQLKSLVCHCGRDKLAMKSFCLDCYRRLPVGIQKALYNKVGFGYEQAYKFAVRTLEEMK